MQYADFGFDFTAPFKKIASVLPDNTIVGKWGRGEPSPLDAAAQAAKALGPAVDPTKTQSKQSTQSKMQSKSSGGPTSFLTKRGPFGVPVAALLALGGVAALLMLKRKR